MREIKKTKAGSIPAVNMLLCSYFLFKGVSNIQYMLSLSGDFIQVFCNGIADGMVEQRTQVDNQVIGSDILTQVIEKQRGKFPDLYSKLEDDLKASYSKFIRKMEDLDKALVETKLEDLLIQSSDLTDLNPEIMVRQKILKSESQFGKEVIEGVDKTSAALRGAMGISLKFLFKFGQEVGKLSHTVIKKSKEYTQDNTVLDKFFTYAVGVGAFSYHAYKNLEGVLYSTTNLITMPLYGLVEGLYSTATQEHDTLSKKDAKKLDKVVTEKSAVGKLFQGIKRDLISAYQARQASMTKFNDTLLNLDKGISSSLEDNPNKGKSSTMLLTKRHAFNIGKDIVDYFDKMVSSIMAVQVVAAKNLYKASKLTGEMIAGIFNKKITVSGTTHEKGK